MNFNKPRNQSERCSYLKACFLAEELRCFGYKTDCPLYRKSNGEFLSEECFNEALDRLINKTMLKYHKVP